LIFQLTHLHQRLPNQPLIPARFLEADSDASDEGDEGEDEDGDEDHDTVDDEE